ncbi:MAG TPA: hypothetical protein VK956_07845, partial [Verrucomicrobium sp.]|nr:hypothetical protein [Verrucomicrobium sp.]
GDLHVASVSGGPGAPLTSYGMHCCRPLKAAILAALQSPGKPGRRQVKGVCGFAESGDYRASVTVSGDGDVAAP